MLTEVWSRGVCWVQEPLASSITVTRVALSHLCKSFVRPTHYPQCQVSFFSCIFNVLAFIYWLCCVLCIYSVYLFGVSIKCIRLCGGLAFVYHAAHRWRSENNLWVGPLPPPPGSLRPNSDGQAWWKVPLIPMPSLYPVFSLLNNLFSYNINLIISLCYLNP